MLYRLLPHRTINWYDVVRIYIALCQFNNYYEKHLTSFIKKKHQSCNQQI